MPLEATVLIIDNSEYMRNGDYPPTRFGAQSDAVNTTVQTKMDANPENTVGLMTMAGKGPEVLVTHTKDFGQILQGLHIASSKIGGVIDIPTAIAIAQLALKHRENKNLRQRIIVFVASPLEGAGADEKSMVKLAKKLKKNNVAVDFVCFGDGIEEPGADGKTILRTFVENVNNNDNSHLVSVPPSTVLLSDALIVSPILSADRSSSIPEELMGEAGGASGSGANYEFGVDPTLDPDLAMALRMSMQEAQAREATTNAASAPATVPSANDPALASNPTPASMTIDPTDATDSVDDQLLQRALALSKGDVDMEADAAADAAEDEEDEDEDAAIARAIEMSLRGEEEDENKKP